MVVASSRPAEADFSTVRGLHRVLLAKGNSLSLAIEAVDFEVFGIDMVFPFDLDGNSAFIFEAVKVRSFLVNQVGFHIVTHIHGDPLPELRALLLYWGSLRHPPRVRDQPKLCFLVRVHADSVASSAEST